jgi:hypothetical protein
VRINRWFGAVKRWLESQKNWFESTQAVATVVAIVLGGIWTYRLFIAQRQGFAHANFEEKISSVALTDQVRLVQVILKLENIGHSLIKVTDATVKIQQVLPIRGCDPSELCAARELNEALDSRGRSDDRFDWPVIAERDEKTLQPIEPGEKALLDFEFAVPASVEVARVYGFIQNDELTEKRQTPVGWNDVRIYDLRSSSEVTRDGNENSAPAHSRRHAGSGGGSPTS